MDVRLQIWPCYVLKLGDREIKFTRSEGAMISRMARGSAVTLDDLTDSLYFHREDGGAETAPILIKVYIYKLRKKLAGTPFRIIKPGMYSYQLLPKLGDTLDAIADSVLDD